MIKNKFSKKKNIRVKDKLLRYFLIISIFCSAFLVSNCDHFFDFFDPGNGGDITNPPEFGGSESSSYASFLFSTVGKAALGDVTGTGVSWAMGALGLSDQSSGPDYTEQLNKIVDDLNEIINQLNGIQNELSQINTELKIINCSEWATQLVNEENIVDDLWQDYQTYVATAANSGVISDSTVKDWVDKVLAIGNYSNRESMDQVLSAFEGQLVKPGGQGVLPACIQPISPPAKNSFGKDTVYYNTVNLFINYYYVYQVKALFLYNEAQHYEAWVAAGKPNASSSNYLSADSVSYVCSNPNAKVYCNLAAGRTNILYNSLIQQFTSGGAPYTNDYLLMQYDSISPRIWIKSLEDFTTAAGDNCAGPLNSAKPCGAAAGVWNDELPAMSAVTYKGYTNWTRTNSEHLETLLSGWKSGTAGDYLENTFSFQNMKNKIILSTDAVSIKLKNSLTGQDFVAFFDTDLQYSFIGGFINKESQYDLLAPQTYGTPCYYDDFSFRNVGWYYSYTSNSTLNSLQRNNFYKLQGKEGQQEDNIGVEVILCSPFSWGAQPGWLASNTGSSARQFHWPLGHPENFSCTNNRGNKNTAGVWTMCGDDFTAFLEYNVPRPPSCDNPGAGITCNVSASVVAKANREFGDSFKSKRSFLKIN